MTVSVPGDRPAAELLLAEWKSLVLPYAEAGKVPPLWQRFAVAHLDGVLERLARAEQALAAIAKPHTPHVDGYCDGCGWPFPCLTVRAVRASQESDRG